ncbi:MAG: dynamin family protein [Gammaproteobacteria bacterium]|nr:MAG: dynamin family protein [Gammaproteobacteria bacterium]
MNTTESLQKRLDSLKSHLERENPILIDAIDGYRALDGVAHRTGLLDESESHATQISWWPLVSILGVFSAGKSSFINSYLDKPLQKTGNQAVDDKFTVICYGEENAGRTLPGLALDADMRFPFYRISDEIEKVTEGEGRRIDSYLQLKVTDSEVVRGKILIDSPGFDADQQRTSTLKLTNHIMDISDLVLVFFDARHPEPGSMQDTLTHLVEQTISRNDSNKFVFILNQIDTAAREDNTEEIVGAWQRALSQKGLTAGRFYTIYNKAVAPTIEDEGKRRRFEEKRDHDMAEIEDRIRQVEVERAYRIVGQMEKRAYHLRDTAMPALAEYKRRWAQRIVRTDLVLLAILAVLVLGVAIATGAIGSLGSLLLSIVADPVAMGGTILGLAAVLLGGHFLVKNLVGKLMLHGIRKGDDASLARAFAMNTRWFRSIFNRQPVGWNNRAKKQINGVIEGASRFVQSLNDQFTNPSGQVREADQTGRKTT